MSSFWKTVLFIVLALGVMLVLTYAIPALRTFAVAFAAEKKLPLWLVGLAGPILYLVSRGRDALAGLLGPSTTEQSIHETNEAIKQRIDQLQTQVRELDSWRQTEINRRMNQVQTFETQVSALQQEAGALDRTTGTLLEQRESLRNAIQEESGEID